MFLPNVPGATFIQGATSIPESRVVTTSKGMKKKSPEFEAAYDPIFTRRPVPSTVQALPSCFYFRIS